MINYYIIYIIFIIFSNYSLYFIIYSIFYSKSLHEFPMNYS